MSNIKSQDKKSTRQREDVLRELNLFPLWQLRAPVYKVAEPVEPVPVLHMATAAIAEPAVASEIPQAGIGDLNWAELKKRVKTCTACKLRGGCMQTVFGTGDEKADWLFVGSWPTEDDETCGEPFAGQHGQLLDNMLAAIKLKRGVNVYLANVVKCSGSIKIGPRGGRNCAMLALSGASD